MDTVKTLDAFKTTTNEAICAAIDKFENETENETDNDDSILSDDPIMIELDRLITEYEEVYDAYIHGTLFEADTEVKNILHYTPKHPIEQAAYEIFLETLEDTDEDE